MYLRNGDPGYPDEPPEFCVTKVSLVFGDGKNRRLFGITDLVEEMGGLDLVDQLAYEAAEREGAFDEPERPAREE